MNHARSAAVVSLLLAALLLACAPTVRSAPTPALRDAAPVRKVAVAPFRVSGTLADQRDPRVGPPPEQAATLVARHVAEALARRGVEVVPPEDVARVLGAQPGARERIVPLGAARQLAQEFGVDGVVIGDVWRYVERQGEAAGTTRPASVGFEITLYAAPGGARLWSGTFDETQRALSENVLNAGRYPGGGTRWLTAEELLRWGATETAASAPLSP